MGNIVSEQSDDKLKEKVFLLFEETDKEKYLSKYHPKSII